MSKFVLLTHDHPHWHWDLMLESDGILRTWRLDSDPLIVGRIAATPLPDHRLLYLDYEGPVSNQRGHVLRWDRGEYEIVREDDKALEIALRGARLQGRAQLTTASDGAVWFQFTADPSTS